MLSGSKNRAGRTSKDVAGRFILILAKNFVEARDVQHAFQHAGAHVVGPFFDAADALRSLSALRIGCAIIDVEVSNDQRIRVASALQDNDTPVVFLHRGSEPLLPEHLHSIPRVAKTHDYKDLLALAAKLAHTSATPG